MVRIYFYLDELLGTRRTAHYASFYMAGNKGEDMQDSCKTEREREAFKDRHQSVVKMLRAVWRIRYVF